MDWDEKNIESLISSRGLQQSTVQPGVCRPRNKIIFPHVKTRGSVVGNAVYCKTSINNCFNWRRRSRSLCASNSMLLLNFYHERSSDIQSGIAKHEQEPPSDGGDDIEHPPIIERCRPVLLSVAGAAGIQLLFPSLRLPLLHFLLFSHHHKCHSTGRSPLLSRHLGGRWRFPLNLALAISRPFCGSIFLRSLTAVLFILQFPFGKRSEQPSARSMPHLYQLPSLEKTTSLRRDLNLSSKSLDNAADDTEVESLNEEPNNAISSENGETSVNLEEELIKVENDRPDEAPPASLVVSQDVISDDGISSTGESWEQDVISDDGRSSSGDFFDQDLVLEEEEISSIGNSSLKDLDLDHYFGHASDRSHPRGREQSILPPYDVDSPVESPTETCSSVFTTETSSSSDMSRTSDGSDQYSYGVVTMEENPEETNSSSNISSSSVEFDSDAIRSRDEESEETQSTRSISSVETDTRSVNTPREEDIKESHSTSDTSTSNSTPDSDPRSIDTPEKDSEGSLSTLISSTSSAGIDPEEIAENHSFLVPQNWEITIDTFCADLTDEERIPTRSIDIGASQACLSSEQRPEMVENAVEASAAVNDLFPSSNSDHVPFHEEVSPFPSDRNRGDFVRRPDSVELWVHDGESTLGSCRSLQFSPRADLTALMPEELCSGTADGTWEIEVDGLEVVWTPFNKNRRVLVSEGEDESSDFYDESTVGDSDSCWSVDGSQMASEDEELFDEVDRMIVPNADSSKGEGFGPSNSVQGWESGF